MFSCLLGCCRGGFYFTEEMHNAISDVPGIKVGHWTNTKAVTGCTVILCEQGAVAGIDVRGSAPGTRETDALRPFSLVQQAHAVLLTGGSAFGLDAASGVMRYLEERGYGLNLGAVKIPLVPAAVLFDLFIGEAKVRPGAEEGYQACLAATDGEIAEGSVGAGTGATVGKILGRQRATKGGLGTASQQIGDDTVVAAIVVVNAFGDVVNPTTGEILAGPRQAEGGGFSSTVELLKSGHTSINLLPTNTTIGVVATNAALGKGQVNKLAQMANSGLAQAIRPCHTMVDGDTLFALSLGESIESEVNITQIGAVAADVVANAIVRAITKAQTLADMPAAREVR